MKMDNFDKNQVDNELLEKVNEILNGETKEEAPELVFSEEIPKDYDITADLQETAAEQMQEIKDAGDAGFKPDVEVPDAEFNYDAPEAPDFGEFVETEKPEQSDEVATWNGQPTETWESLQEKRREAAGAGKKSGLNPDTQATIGFIIGLIAILVSFIGLALGLLPVVVGIIFSNGGRKGTKRKLAIAGLVMNIIGAVLWVLAVARGFSL